MLVVWVADEGEKHGLIASEPEKFFTTPHYDGHPIVLVRFDGVDTTSCSSCSPTRGGSARRRRC